MAAPKKKITKKVIRKQPKTVVTEAGKTVKVSQKKGSSIWHGILREDDPRSSRRIVTLVVAFVFICTCITVVILLITTFAATNKLININLKALELQTELLQHIMYYQFMIVISGLAFITAPQFAQVLVASIGKLFRIKRITEDEDGSTTVEEKEFFDEETKINTGDSTKTTKTKIEPE